MVDIKHETNINLTLPATIWIVAVILVVLHLVLDAYLGIITILAWFVSIGGFVWIIANFIRDLG